MKDFQVTDLRGKRIAIFECEESDDAIFDALVKLSLIKPSDRVTYEVSPLDFCEECLYVNGFAKYQVNKVKLEK